MKRRTLNGLVKFMFGLIVLAFIYVLLRSLSPIPSSDVALVKDLPLGETVMRRIEGRRVWITHLSDQQRQALQALPDTLVNTETGCQPSEPYCIIDAASGRVGIELVYSKKRPSVLLKSKAWEGGFIDPNSGAIYDLLGRAYKGHAAARSLDTRSQ